MSFRQPFFGASLLWLGAALTTAHAGACFPPTLDQGNPTDFYGYNVALAGNLAAVHAGNDPFVELFKRQDGRWSRSARIPLPPTAMVDADALLVSAQGDELLVGMPTQAVGATSQAGAVLVFRHIAGQWQLQQTLSADVPQSGAYFGARMALEGDWLAVGAIRHDLPGVVDSGAAFVFKRGVDGQFGAPVLLTDPTPTQRSRFGFSLALDQARLLLGADYDDAPGAPDTGSVFVYDLLPGGTVELVQQLQQPGGQASQLFGSALAAGGDRLLVGNNAALAGSAPGLFLYEFSAGAYRPRTLPSPPPPSSANEFFMDADMDGNTAAFAVSPFRGAGRGRDDRVLLLDLTTGSWRTVASPTPGGGQGGLTLFGASLALSGDTLLSSGGGTDVGLSGDQGSAYLHRITDGALVQSLRHGSGHAPAGFGAAIAVVGEHLWVGEPGHDGALDDSGRVLELRPVPGGWVTGHRLTGDSERMGLGERLAAADDLLVVGSPRAATAADPGRGRVQVYRLSAGGAPQSVCELAPMADPARSQFGARIAVAGDRVAVAHGQPTARSVYVYQIGANACTPLASLDAAAAGQPEGAFGFDMTFVGDHLAITHFSAQTPDKVLVFAPQGNSYNLFATLTRDPLLPANPFWGARIAGDSQHLAVALAPSTGSPGGPTSGAIQLFARGSNGYTSLGSAIDPATPGSAQAQSFGAGLAMRNGRVMVGSSVSGGQRGVRLLDVSQPTQLQPLLVLGGDAPSAGFLTDTRLGLGDGVEFGSLSDTFRRGALHSAQTDGSTPLQLETLDGGLPEQLHCSGLEEGH